METIKLFEMFAGYGGASFGLQKANIDFECVGYSEIKKHAIKCYEKNHPNIKNYGDCSKIDTKDLPNFDLLTGGFPCQDVSIAGSRDLEKGRTNLYKEIIRIAKDKTPKYMLLENVKGLISMKDNDRKLINIIISDLNKIGYDVCWKCLKSSDYGIPQMRERIWIVCKLGTWDFNEFRFPNKKPLLILGQNIIEQKVDKKYFVDKEQILKRTRFGDTLIRYNQYTLIVQKHMNELRHYTSIFPTLTGTDTANIYIYQCDNLRRLTPTEAFRLMGFIKDEIDLSVISDNQAYELAGNGWDINLTSLLFKEMFK